MNDKKIDVRKSVHEALDGFKRWWIPLCIISSVILFSQKWLPKYLSKTFVDQSKIAKIKEIFWQHNFVESMNISSTIDNLQHFLAKLLTNSEIMGYILQVSYKLLVISSVVFVIVCVLYIITLIIAKASIHRRSIKDREVTRNIKSSHKLTLSFMVIGFFKTLLFLAPAIPLILVVIGVFSLNVLGYSSFATPAVVLSLIVIALIISFLVGLLGIYIYIRWYFSSFVITEETSNPFIGMKKSWEITRGNFRELFPIVMIVILLDIIAVITIVGIIPITGIKYTLKASAYLQLKD